MLPIRSSCVAAVIGLMSIPAGAAVAEMKKGNVMTMTTPAAQQVITVIDRHLPAGYSEAARRPASVDGEQAELIRYLRVDGRNASLGGEHFSTLVAADGRLKGFVRMDLDLVGGALPTPEDARSIAMDFLRLAAPDLLPVLKISWIAPHDEPLRVSRAGRTEDLTLTGMKVKMRNTADGRWMWVIVGADRKVMVFERDIIWVTFPGHRKTEKWLHDSWLAEKGLSARAS